MHRHLWCRQGRGQQRDGASLLLQQRHDQRRTAKLDDALRIEQLRLDPGGAQQHSERSNDVVADLLAWSLRDVRTQRRGAAAAGQERSSPLSFMREHDVA